MKRKPRRYHVSHYYVLDDLSQVPAPVPCPDKHAWDHWMKHADRVLKRTGDDRLYVATVFTGVDSRHLRYPMERSFVKPPRLFAVLVFRNHICRVHEHYPTWKDAEKAHDRYSSELVFRIRE